MLLLFFFVCKFFFHQTSTTSPPPLVLFYKLSWPLHKLEFFLLVKKIEYISYKTINVPSFVELKFFVSLLIRYKQLWRSLLVPCKKSEKKKTILTRTISFNTAYTVPQSYKVMKSFRTLFQNEGDRISSCGDQENICFCMKIQ